MIKAVFFDAIDTLFCAYPNKIDMYRRIIKKHTGLDVSAQEMSMVWSNLVEENEKDARKTLGNDKFIVWDNFNGKLLENLGYKGNSREKGRELLLEAWGNETNFILFNDVKETIKFLKEDDINLACVSNEMNYLYKFFIHFNIEDYFDFVLTSEEAGYEKPSPEIFHLALEKARLEPEEVLFVGDSIISDYAGAKNVGMIPLLIDRENKAEQENINKIKTLTEIKHYIN